MSDSGISDYILGLVVSVLLTFLGFRLVPLCSLGDGGILSYDVPKSVRQGK